MSTKGIGRLDRREILEMVGVGSALGLAGCIGDNDSDDGSDSSGSDDDGGDESSQSPIDVALVHVATVRRIQAF